jgi:hypothetical protein
MKDEKPFIRRKTIPQLPLGKENKLKERSKEALGRGKTFYLVFFFKEENECMKGELICYE